MTKFILVLSRNNSTSEFDVTCAISGETEGWHGITRRFVNQAEAEQALRGVGALPPVAPSYNLQAVASGVNVALFVDTKAAIDLQVLQRLQSNQRKRTMVFFHDRRGGLPDQTAHYLRAQEIVVGEILSVETPLGRREVPVLAICNTKVVPYGSEDTRCEVRVEVEF